MKKDERDIYRRLADLNTDAGDKLLEREVLKVKSAIVAANDYDEVGIALTRLGQFAYKFPKQTIQIIKDAISMKDFIVKKHSTDFGTFDGKNYTDIIKQCLDILDEIRYLETVPVFKIYRSLFKTFNGESQIAKDLKQKIGNIAGYEVRALKAIGYSVQYQITDELLKRKAITSNALEFYIEVVGHMNSTEVTIQHMKDALTLSLNWGVLNYSKTLEDLRWKLLSSSNDLLEHYKDRSESRKIVQLQNGFFSHFYHQGVSPSAALEKMMERERNKQYTFYLKIISSALKSEKPNLPLFLEITESIAEQQKGNEKVSRILDKLSTSPLYKFYESFIEDRMALRSSSKSYEDIRKEVELHKEEVLKNISTDNWSQYADWIDIVSSFEAEEDSWRLAEFNNFIISLAEAHPTLAIQLLNNRYKGFSNSLGYLAIGYAKGEKIEMFNKVVDKVSIRKKSRQVYQICIALGLMPLDRARPYILDLSKFKNNFEFLREQPKRFLIEPIVDLLLRLHVERIDEGELSNFIKRNEIFSEQIVGAVTFACHKDPELPIKLEHEITDVLLELCVNVPVFDYHVEDMAGRLLNGDSHRLFSIFENRIIRSKDKKTSAWESRYTAVPYNFERNFALSFTSNPSYGEAVSSVVDSFGDKWTMRDFEMSNLIRNLGHYQEIIKEYIEKSDTDVELKKMVNFMSGFGPAPFSIILLIASKTSSQRIWDSCYSLLYNTGVVSGEYGLAEAHEGRALELKAHINSTNQNLAEFAKQGYERFKDAAQKERKRSDEDRRLLDLNYPEESES